VANTNKRVDEGILAVQKSVYTAMQSIPEFANNPDRAKEVAKKYFKKLWRSLARAGIRAKGESYQKYLDRKWDVKNTGREIAITLGEQFGLSPKSTKMMYGIVAGAAKLAKDKEIEIPSTRIVDREDITVEAGGYADVVDDIYRASLTGTFKDTFGSGIDVTGGVRTSYTPGGVSIDQAHIGAEAPFLGGTLSARLRGNLDEQQARLGYTLPLKKGGKVTKKRKKRKTKKYSQGCVVRSAKY